MSTVVSAMRKTVPIPIIRENKNIASLIEVGGKLFSKEQTYELFFELGFELVKKTLKKEYIRRGGTPELFEKVLKEADLKIKKKYSVN